MLGDNYFMTPKTAREKIECLLGKRIKCTLVDGRAVEGSLVAIDRKKNIILVDALERRNVNTRDYSDSTDREIGVSRALNQVMIPGERLVKVETEQSIFESALRHDED